MAMPAASSAGLPALPALLATRQPFLMLADNGAPPRAVSVWLDLAPWFASASTSAGACRLGSLRWVAVPASAGAERGAPSKPVKGSSSSGRVPLHAISDVRMGCATGSTAALPPDQCLSIAHIAVATAPVAASPAPADASADFRGLRCTRHSLDLALASGGPPLGEWIAALLAHLEQRLGHRLLSPAVHEALRPPVPSSLIDAWEGGIEVRLHARAAPGSDVLRSTRALLWLNAQRDSFFWSVLPSAAAAASATESDQSSLPLDSISDVFCGMHDPIWTLVHQQAQEANAEIAEPSDDTVLTIRGSQPRNLTAQGQPTAVELHIKTPHAQTQSMLLALIQYANELADRGQRVQSCVVVDVPKTWRKLHPQFLPGSSQSPAAVSAAASSHSAAATSSPAQSARRHVADVNLSADPMMHSLASIGVPVTLFLTSPQDGHIEGQDGLLLYAFDAASMHGQLRWSCSNGAAGRANFTDLSAIVPDRSDPIFMHDACAGSDADCCLSIHTAVAGVRAQAGLPPAVVRGFKLHLCTQTAEARTRLVAALEYAIEHSPAKSAPSSNGSSHTTSPSTPAANAAAPASAFTLPPAAANAAAKSSSASPKSAAKIAASPSKPSAAAPAAVAAANGTPKASAPMVAASASKSKVARARVKIGSAPNSAPPSAVPAATAAPVARKTPSSAAASSATANANGKPALKKKPSAPSAAASGAAAAAAAATAPSSSSSLAVPEPQYPNGTASLLPPNASPMPVSSPAQLRSPSNGNHSSTSPALEPYTPETAQSAMMQAFLATEGASASFPPPADPVTPPAATESTGEGFDLSLEQFSATTTATSVNQMRQSQQPAPVPAPAAAVSSSVLDPVDLLASLMATGQIPTVAPATVTGLVLAQPPANATGADSAAAPALQSNTAATISTEDIVVSLAPSGSSADAVAVAPRTMQAVDTAASAKGTAAVRPTASAESEPTSASSEVAWSEPKASSAAGATNSASAPASTLRSSAAADADDADEFGSSDDSDADDEEGDEMYGRGAPKPQGTAVISPGSVSAARAKLIATGFMPLSPVRNPAAEGCKFTLKPTPSGAPEVRGSQAVAAEPDSHTTELSAAAVVAASAVASVPSTSASVEAVPPLSSVNAGPIQPLPVPAAAPVVLDSAVLQSSFILPVADSAPAAAVATTSSSAAPSPASVVAAPASISPVDAPTAAVTVLSAAPSSAPTSAAAALSSASAAVPAASSSSASARSSDAAIIPSPGLESLLRTVNPFRRALATLADGCAFTSLRLSNPQDLQSPIMRDKIFMWLNPHPDLEADSAEEPESEGAGALFWCPLIWPRSHQTKVESPARRMDIARLADLFLGRQFGLFVARAELESVDDHLALSFVAMPSVSESARTEHDPPQHLDLLAENAPEFQNWMQAFNIMLHGEIAEDMSDVNRRASLPLDDAVLGRAGRVQLSTLASSEEDLHRMVLVAQHWSRLSDDANEGLASNIALGQWCLARMREGCRARVVVHGPEGRLQAQRSFLVFRDDEAEGTILSSRCQMDEAPLLGTPASASSHVPDSHALAVREMTEVVLGRCAGAWTAFPPSVAHGRSLSFVHVSTSTLDVEFDSVSHLLIWVLGLKYLLLQAADPVTFQPALVAEGRAIPATAQSLLASCRASIERACAAAHWSQSLAQSLSDPSLELLQRGAIFELFSSSGNASASVASQTIHLFFSFEDTSTDGRFGSLYWNHCVGYEAPAAPWIKSPHRRMELAQIATVLHGRIGGAMVEADTFFCAHSQQVQSILGERAKPSPACLTLHSDDESLHLVWLRSASATAAAPSSTSALDAWLSGLEQLLERAGRTLLLESTVGTGASWRSVGGGSAAEQEVESVVFAPVAPSAGSSSASSSALPSIAPPSLAAHQRAFSFMAPVLTPEFLAAQSLLKRGLRFFLYSQTAGADVTRRAVTIYYSRSLPPRGLCDPRSFDLPAGETEFPALWAVDEVQHNLGPAPPAMLRLDNMRADRCLCLHELTDLFVGIAHNPVWRDPSALAQFGPFRDEDCLTVLATCVTGARTHALSTEWNLQTIEDVAGLENWIQALCVVLPVHAQEADAVPATPSPASPSAAPRPGQTLSVVVTPADSGNASLASYPAPMLTPNSLLSIGASFLLLRPAVPGAVHSLHPLRVHLFWMSAAHMRELGVSVTDAVAFPVQCKLPPGETFQGALYWRPLDSAASAIGAPYAPITRADLRADRCMPLHSLTDIYHGRETPLFRAPAQSSIPAAECMSFVASLSEASDSDGIEWNLHCLDQSAPGAAANIVSNFVGGIAALVEKAGKAFSDADVVDAETKSAASTVSVPAGPTPAPASATSVPTVHTAAMTPSEADRRSRGVSGLLPSPASPTAAHLLTASMSVEEVLSVLRNPVYKADSALHTVGVTLLHNHCVSVESSASSGPGCMTALIDLGVGRQVVESMLAFPRNQQIQCVGCTTILILAVSADDEIQLAAQRSITAVLAALENHVVSAAIVEAATGALLNLCLNLRNAEAVGDGGGLESLFSCLRCHPKSPRIVQSVLACIASLVLVERNRVHFSGLGGLECVVGMLKKYPASNIDEKDVGVHVFACAALRNLVAHHAASKTALLSAGGLPLILSSLNRFRRHRRLQLHALGLLWNASACHTPTKTALGYGVPLSLLASMQAHPRDAEVVGLALGVLKHSATVANNRSGMVDAGVIDACVDAQRSHASSALVQRQAASLMTLLADSSARAEEIVRAGGIDSTVTCLRASLSHPRVAESCCGALWMLARAPAAALRSVSCDSLIALADSALATHTSHAGVQKMAAGMRSAWVGVAKAAKHPSAGPAPARAQAPSASSAPQVSPRRMHHAGPV